MSLAEYIVKQFKHQQTLQTKIQQLLFVDLSGKANQLLGNKIKSDIIKQQYQQKLNQLSNKLEVARSSVLINPTNCNDIIQEVSVQKELDEQVKEEICIVMNCQIIEHKIKLQSYFKLVDIEIVESNLKQYLTQPSTKISIQSDHRGNNFPINSYFTANKPIIPEQINHISMKQDRQLNQIPNNIINNNEHAQKPMQQHNQNVTPANFRKTSLIQNKPAMKESFLSQLSEIDQYSYKNNNKQSRRNPEFKSKYNDENRVNPIQPPFYGEVSQQSSMNQSNLYFSKICKSSLQCSTIQQESHIKNHSSLFESRLSQHTQKSPDSYANWVIFIAENCPFRFPQQFQLQTIKFWCTQIDQQFFDDYEYIIISDKFKILIIEQRDLMTPEIHMRLNKQDDTGAIEMVLLQLRRLTQQLMMQYSNKEIIILIQYENQYFYHLIQDWIMPELGVISGQFSITLFNYMEELKHIVFQILLLKENIKSDKQIVISQDQNQLKKGISQIDFHMLVRIKCLNSVYGTLLSYFNT